jgi:hypothetical protein
MTAMTEPKVYEEVMLTALETLIDKDREVRETTNKQLQAEVNAQEVRCHNRRSHTSRPGSDISPQ